MSCDVMGLSCVDYRMSCDHYKAQCSLCEVMVPTHLVQEALCYVLQGPLGSLQQVKK